MQICTKCKEEKLISEYYVCRFRNATYGECIDCVKKRTGLRKTAQKRRLDDIKIESGCVDCGYKENPVALQFDHIGNNKEFTIGQKASLSWERLQAEVDKCEVVCANCHSIRTQARRKQNGF